MHIFLSFRSVKISLLWLLWIIHAFGYYYYYTRNWKGIWRSRDRTKRIIFIYTKFAHEFCMYFRLWTWRGMCTSVLRQFFYQHVFVEVNKFWSTKIRPLNVFIRTVSIIIRILRVVQRQYYNFSDSVLLWYYYNTVITTLY